MSMLGRLVERLRPKPPELADGPLRISVDHQPPAVYAIGDIHGCLDLLLDLEARILAEPRPAAEESWIIVLGDFVDRGPSSAAVIDHLMQPGPPGYRRIVLRGNHEAMMLAFLAAPRPNSPWLEQGGRETLTSYGIPLETLSRASGNRAFAQLVESHVPRDHIEFLHSLPCLVETPLHLFAHAGLNPQFAAAAQRERDLLWYRDDFAETFSSFGKRVVHGHQMRDEPLLTDFRVAIDTGACLSGKLTAACLGADGSVKFIQSRNSPRQAKPDRTITPLL